VDKENTLPESVCPARKIAPYARMENTNQDLVRFFASSAKSALI
jgi:hypothetical protein